MPDLATYPPNPSSPSPWLSVEQLVRTYPCCRLAERVRDEEAVLGEGPPHAPSAGGRRGGAAGRRAGAGVCAHRGGPGGAALLAVLRRRGPHPSEMGCGCFGCYKSFWERWDASPNRPGALGCYKSFCSGTAYEAQSREAMRSGSRCTAAVRGAPGGCWIGRERGERWARVG
jgi:hypothetical protein